MYTHNRCHVDDGAGFLAHHDRKNGVDIVERRFEVNGNHSIPLLLGHAEHETIFCDTCVVDQDVDVTEVILDLLHNLLGSVEVCRIGSVTLALHAICSDFLLGFLAVLVDDEVGECDVTTLRSEFEGDFLSYATGCTCYDSHFSFKHFHFYLLLSVDF